MMKFTEKEIKIFKGVSLVSGLFTVVIAITMIFSFVQLRSINPLDNPALQSVRDQYEKDPENKDKAEQLRAMDLMSRKAYFSSRWQVETGSYLLVAGAAIFVLFQRLIAGSEKPSRLPLPDKPDIEGERRRNRKYLLISGSAVVVLAIVSSFVLRTELPSPGRHKAAPASSGNMAAGESSNLPGDINYPFFRGEGSRGIAGGSGYPVEWDGGNGKNIKWKTEVPRPGKSSPVIWGDKIYLTGAEGSTFEIYCFDKNSGKILWTASGSDFPGASKEVPESDSEAGMAVPTAAAWENGICAIFGNANLVCYSHDGKLKWAENIGVPHVTYAFSSSLVIWDKLLLIQYDSQDKRTISGYDLETGELKWETARPGREVNSSPVLAMFEGQPQVLINGNPNISSYDAVNGKELWSLPGVSGDVAPSLAVNSTMVFAALDYSRVVALKPGKNGSTAWEDNTCTPDISSPVANDQHLYISNGNGEVACYNAQKGDTLWLHYFENPFNASPVICDGKVWMLDKTGVMQIVEDGGSFNKIASCILGEGADCTPAFSEKKIFIRGKHNLYCIAAE